MSLQESIKRIQKLSDKEIVEKFAKIPTTERELIKEYTDALCHDRTFCKFAEINYCEIKNIDYMRIFLGIYESEKQNKE
jgi:hypothetical protein